MKRGQVLDAASFPIENPVAPYPHSQDAVVQDFRIAARQTLLKNPGQSTAVTFPSTAGVKILPIVVPHAGEPQRFLPAGIQVEGV
jgi:hypothetical protein